ncbi:hypothetical protein VTN02DRAFT_3815 [Thermoascus thermophilus]
MVPTRVELATLALLAPRSNRLSYGTLSNLEAAHPWLCAPNPQGRKTRIWGAWLTVSWESLVS